VAPIVLSAAFTCLWWTAHPRQAQATDFVWTGPSISRDHSGNWSDEGNWSPSRRIPNDFSDTATINLDVTAAYEVRVDRDAQVMGLALDSRLATLLATGLVSGRDGRSIELAPGGSLKLLDGRLEGDLRFLLQSGVAVIGAGLVAERGSRVEGSPVVIARGRANSLTAAAAQLGANSPAIAVVADDAAAGLTLQGQADEREFHLLEGAVVTLDAARGNTATLAVGDGARPFHLVNSGEITTGAALVHEGGAVLALELEQAAGGVLEVNSPTTLGFASGATLIVHRNNGRIDLHDEMLKIAPFNLFINGEGGTISGSGAIAATTPIANFGVFHPDVAVQGDLVNEATALLAFELGGPVPGVDYDQLVVSGNVTLGGTLQIALADGFSPQIGDAFAILSAGAVSGQFARILLPALQDDKAILLLPNNTSVSLQTTEPVPVALASALPTSPLAEAFGGLPPQSNWSIDLANVSGHPQRVVVTESDTNVVHSISVTGGADPQATMTLLIEENAHLAATSTISVGANGHFVLAEGAEAIAPSFEIAGGGLTGGGTLVGDLYNSGHVSPSSGGAGKGAVGVLTIDGDYIQGADGMLEIDVLGLAPGEYDVLKVTGDFTLAGTVVLDLSEFEPSSGFAIEVIDSDGTPVTEEPMCDVKGNGKCAINTGQAIGPHAGIIYFLPGDFNQDGKVDREDLAIWQDTFGMSVPPPEVNGDADNNGVVDGDDLLALFFNLGAGTMAAQQSAATVPEPECLALVLVCLGVFLSGARSRGRTTNCPIVG
jgi:hypothetical protein